ncbi:MAG: hypothetical protein HDS35_08265 [Bacteroides sp.]|nr:hypothetical protein [Bacteroides sp.]
MSKNVISTIGQHAFKYDPPKYTEKGAPVLAKNPTPDEEKMVMESGKEPKFQFLGSGFYFWDNNIGRAHDWGHSRCNGKYLILEIPLVLTGDHFLDLVGSREDLMVFMDVYEKMRKLKPGLKVGAFFHGMQTMARHKPDVWPFKTIRALNVKGNSNKVLFNSIPNSHMLLNPEIIICFYDKNELILQDSRYIDKNNRVWTPSI